MTLAEFPTHCPECNAEKIWWRTKEPDAPDMIFHMHCKSCDARWKHHAVPKPRDSHATGRQ